MFRAIQTRIEFKILLLIIAVLVGGFGTYVVLTIQQESRNLFTQAEEKLELFSESTSAGIRNVMLTGKAPFAVSFVNDTRDNLRFASITVYDRFGREVFLREGEGVVYNVQDEGLRLTLSTRGMTSLPLTIGDMSVYGRYEPLQNRPECWRCHDPRDPLRGALLLGLRPEPLEAASRMGIHDLAGGVGRLVAAAFRTIMLGGQGEMMDTLTARAREIPGVQRVQVYSRSGWLAFGPEGDELDENEILPVIERRSTDVIFEERGPILRVLLPLANEERCQVCHGSRNPMRGVIVADFDRATLIRTVRGGVAAITAAVQATVSEGFRSIMLVGRASSTRYYMDEVRAHPLVSVVRVFDKEQNERFLNPPLRERKEIRDVVASGKPLQFVENVEGMEYLVRLSPLPNEVRCHSCHGKNHDVRGVVEVSTPMTAINAAIEANQVRSAAVGVLTILLTWFVLRQFLKSVVVRPVQDIGRVAERVGSGDFSVTASVHTQDEIGNLGRRINEMVQGLRERFHLQKFVSEQTVRAIRSADSDGLRLGGERRKATVFFSDIRGFTSFAERRAPEEVVTLLNHCLSAQAAIVRRHGGDIDKYVGDELVAVFEGDGAGVQAVRAALEIQKVMSEVGGREVRFTVGIGINTGDMVMGAMGSEDRMTYTMIGDSVNLGSRLCGIAKPGQILISESTAALLRDEDGIRLTRLEPVMVKGRSEPVIVYEVGGFSQGMERT